jgi:ketosteroid isomerase-like protein
VSRENVELVRSIYEASERGDFSREVDWVHPEMEYVVADGPSPGAWTGVAGFVEGWRDQASPWEGFRAEAEEFRELDDQRVLVLTRRHGRGKTSGLEKRCL